MNSTEDQEGKRHKKTESYCKNSLMHTYTKSASKYFVTKHLYTDLWTRAIHLLQIEPSRSAETPNSFRDLNDMLTNNTSVLFV